MRLEQGEIVGMGAEDILRGRALQLRRMGEEADMTKRGGMHECTREDEVLRRILRGEAGHRWHPCDCGGGRESGSGNGQTSTEKPDLDKSAMSEAAANPAALCPIRHIECLSREHDARIRELDAELADVKARLATSETMRLLKRPYAKLLRSRPRT